MCLILGPVIPVDIYVSINSVKPNGKGEYMLQETISGMPLSLLSECFEQDNGIITWVNFTSQDFTRSIMARNITSVPQIFNAPIVTLIINSEVKPIANSLNFLGRKKLFT